LAHPPEQPWQVASSLTSARGDHRAPPTPVLAARWPTWAE
jgi:hypothetical protein